MALLLLASHVALASEIDLNEAHFANAPLWLKSTRAQRVIDRISRYLEWDIRKINVTWYTSQAEFEPLHGYGPTVLAFSRPQDYSVHIGPRVTAENFDQVFGHELTHIVIFQKYKNAIPRWLDEGMANFVAKQGRVDYAWLATQPQIDVRTMSHPFQDANPRFHYQASQALMEMISSKCQIHELLQLATGSHLENYLSTTCGISDLNAAFRAWIHKKAPGAFLIHGAPSGN
ncbi:MAG: hypothetical protein ACXWP5_00945 [Bdellovibrionota bacterium]